MEHEPRGLLRDAERPSEFVRADPVLGVGDQPHGGKPLVEPERESSKIVPTLRSDQNHDRRLITDPHSPPIGRVGAPDERDGNETYIRPQRPSIGIRHVPRPNVETVAASPRPLRPCDSCRLCFLCALDANGGRDGRSSIGMSATSC